MVAGDYSWRRLLAFSGYLPGSLTCFSSGHKKPCEGPGHPIGTNPWLVFPKAWRRVLPLGSLGFKEFKSLAGLIARNRHCKSHCKESLQGVIARSHCKESWQGVIARQCHCKESLQGVIARSQVQVASARSQVQLTCEELKSLLRAAG